MTISLDPFKINFSIRDNQQNQSRKTAKNLQFHINWYIEQMKK